eukprot:XP_011455797.2 PREDICTED: receptor-type tyrosine-protein phosphatase alpha-like [Crassostrea gigas]
MGCDQNRYGVGCTKLCPLKCKNRHCDAFNGSCAEGCVDPNALTADCILCSDREYISNRRCVSCKGHCKNGAPCNKLTGQCDSGCDTQWTGLFCERCSEHFYGLDCNTPCGHCLNNDVCDNVTGRCPNGCKNQWTEERCDVCRDRYYGSNCSTPCGHCKNNDVCNNVSGLCPRGCQRQWMGNRCDECEVGFYNANCTAMCGFCANDQLCDKRTGACLNGCKQNFKLPHCQECEAGFYNGSCTLQCGNCKAGTACDKINGSCPDGCADLYEPPFCIAQMMLSDDSIESSGAVAGGIVSVLAVLVALGVVGLVYRRHKGGKKPVANINVQQTKPSSNQSRREQKYANISENSQRGLSGEFTNETTTDDNGGYYNTKELATFIRVEDLQRVLQEKSNGESNVFLSEYKRLPVANTSICKEGKKQENMAKNRFKTTFPYDHSRVILNENWNESDNDYINANFIKNYEAKKAYIAAQGPKNNSLEDFWRMIWQENIRFIVMLTNVVENGKNKCIQYWPEKVKLLEVGPCKMHLLKESTYALYTCRKFSVLNSMSSEKRALTQYHYTAWPDHGTPEALGLVQFHKAVTRNYQPGGLMLVHCSAGVGRTGTFIGLDSLLKQGRETGKINVFEFVKQMREDRMTMVQTPEQYIFLHKALLIGFQDMDTVLLKSDVTHKFNILLNDKSPLKQTALYKEHQFLLAMKPVHDNKDKADSMLPENKEKNANMDILPVSKYRPYLTSYVKGRSDYINAVRVQSFSDPSAFILTQMPLQDTEVDLWRLCVNHDVNAMVILTEYIEEIHWIPRKEDKRECTPYTLSFDGSGSSISGVSVNTLVIAYDDQRRELDVFHIPVRNDSAMLKGVELLLEKERENNFKSVIVSRDSAGPAGVFCVLHNALQQLRMDGEVDILATVRMIQTRRPEVITKLEEYKRCYELIFLSISEDGIYANM